MGMAASQARWLGLTARKTNVEYEGQQINQQRTALANQSANTFNELLELEVPTAPSQTDYTKVVYSYEDGTVTENIESMTALTNDPDGYNYLVTHYHFSNVYTGIQNQLANPQVTIGTSGEKGSVARDNVTYDEATKTYSVNGHAVKAYDKTVEEEAADYDTIVKTYPELAKGGDVMSYQGDDGKYHFTTLTDLSGTSETIPDYTVETQVPTYVGTAVVKKFDPTDSVQNEAYKQICKDFPASDFAKADPNDLYTWTYQGETRYACLSDFQTAYDSAPDHSAPTIGQDKLTYYTAKDLSTKISQTQKAIAEIGADGRVSSLRFENSTAQYAVNSKTETDTAAYDDAMNQYNYNMQVYEKRIADINAKTEKIQQQDRTLELRLKQLDTEQEALQTEMEAVQKVIEKNIESTFKTFES